MMIIFSFRDINLIWGTQTEILISICMCFYQDEYRGQEISHIRILFRLYI